MTCTEFFSDAEQFAVVVQPLIDRDPVGATMMSHVLAGHIASPFPEAPLLATVRDDDRIRAAAMRVPVFPMIVVVDPEIADPTDLFDDLAGAVLARLEPIVGFTARRKTAEWLTAAWTARTGSVAKQRMSTLMHRLTDLIEPVGVPGEPRLASMDDPADVDLLAGWFCEFRNETGVGRTAPVPDPETLLRNAERGEVFTIWCDDGRSVAVAGHSPVRHGTSKIAPVYTPPDRRRRGFGSAVTAAAVRSAYRLGASEITLFTDAEYLPSNIVYRQLGFEVIGEFAEFDVVATSRS